MRQMDKGSFRLFVSAFLCLLFLAGCGGGGGGNGGNDGVSEAGIDVSGMVTPPEDIAANTLTIVGLNQTTTPSSSGTFTIPVKNEGITAVGAMFPDKEFGYLTIVNRSGSASPKGSGQQALQNEESIAITSQTTAEGMVFLSPYLANSDPSIAEQIMAVIHTDAKVADLVSVIESVYSQLDPMSDPELQEALGEAIQSVVNTLYQTQEKTIFSNSPPIKSNFDVKKTTKIIQLPLLSTQATPETIGESPLDLDMTLLTITASESNYVIEPQVELGHNVDWLIDFSELDPSQFPNGLADVHVATNRDIFDRQGFRDSSYAVATSYFTYLDILGTAIDFIVSYFTQDTIQPIIVPGNTPAVYVSRAYSGGMADLYEKDTVIPQVPDGSEFDASAMVTNAALVATDIVSLIIKIPDELLGCLMETTIEETNDLIGQYLPGGLTVGEYVTIIGNGAKAGITAFIPCGGEAVFNNFLGFLGKTILSGVSSVLDVTGKVSAIGEATQRAVEIVLYATPMESTIIIIGDPFLTAPDTAPPSTPTGLTATAVSSTQINLSWNASSDNVGVIGYKVYRGGSYLKSVTGISTSDTGLSPSTQYCYTVSAYDAASNESAQSSQQCATTQAAGTAPSAPTGVNAVAGDGQVTISWNAVSGADSYNLYWNTTSPVTKATGFKIAGVTSPYIHTGRTNGVTYYYVVTAVNANGESVESSQVSATPSFTLLSNMPTARAYMASAVVNGKIYVIGGWDGDQVLTTVEEYNPATNTWKTKMPIPTARSDLFASAVSNKIYAIGGWDGNQVLSIVEEYDPATDSWSIKAPMLTPRCCGASSVVGNKIYTLGGWDDSPDSILDINEEYDPLLDTWTPKSSMPDSRIYFVSETVNGKIYAVGAEWLAYDWPMEFDPITNAWQTKGLTLSFGYGASSAEVNGKIYLVGEDDVAFGIQDEVWEYDPSEDNGGFYEGWDFNKADMPTARAYLASEVVNGKIYSIGGWDGNNVLAIVEVYDPLTNSWANIWESQ